MENPLVAIVGAPNVGKSTLFNRLVGRRHAIVTDEPGVTRDRLYGVVRDAPRHFRVVDTGGLTPRTAAPFAREIERQAETAMAEACVVLFVVDARAGATALDRELAEWLRKRGGPTVLVASKVDTPELESTTHELHGLGLGPPVAISAEHGLGIEDLLAVVAEKLGEPPEEPGPETDDSAVRVAIVGRPNVGKSSIFNRLLGEERALVSEVPGTTRDAVDTVLTVDDRRYRLVDTAGLRRPGRVHLPTERFSVNRARRNIDACDVAVLVLDATQELAAQDAHVAGFVRQAFKPMVVAVNKWDLVSGREAAVKAWESRIRRRLRFAKQVPLVFTSAVSGQRVSKILDLVDTAHRAAGIRVPTHDLNRWLQRQPAAAPTPSVRGGFRLFYATQTGVHPPSFVLFCNEPARAHFSLRRNLENRIREAFGFESAPIRLRFRGRREATSR